MRRPLLFAQSLKGLPPALIILAVSRPKLLPKSLDAIADIAAFMAAHP